MIGTIAGTAAGIIATVIIGTIALIGIVGLIIIKSLPNTQTNIGK